MSVTVLLRGGLGNQLFQYAAGYAKSVALDVPLLLDTVLLPRAEVSLGGVRRWTEQISAFAHAGSFIDSSKGSAARKRLRQSTAGWQRQIGDSRLGFLNGKNVYAHETRNDTTELRAMTSRAVINSYCYSPAFFGDVTVPIIEQVTALAHPGVWYLETKQQMDELLPVALHVRWGDFLNLTHVYGSISAAYYRRGVELVNALAASGRPVWLFSDDPDGASAFLAPHIEISRVVAPPPESCPLENLLLLSGSSALVAANSSFSWWAALLSQRPGRPVVFPRPLFAPTGPPEPKEWLIPEWIQIGRD